MGSIYLALFLVIIVVTMTAKVPAPAIAKLLTLDEVTMVAKTTAIARAIMTATVAITPTNTATTKVVDWVPNPVLNRLIK